MYDYSDLSPTERIYAQLEDAYDFYNDELFGAELAGCLLTLARSKRAAAYFAFRRFRDPADDSNRVHEISLNPDYAAETSIEEFLSTLVHEMCHCWRAQQPDCSMRENRGYHSAEWARKMQEVGLIPSDTGMPGGKKTGDKMSDYIEDEGPFTLATAELLAAGWRLDYVDGRAWLQGNGEPEKPNKKTKSCYVCPGCDVRLWGKQDVQVACIPCDVRLAERR